MQSSFSDLEYAAKKKLTWRDRFLAGIHAVAPWTVLEAEIEPFYPKGEGRASLSFDQEPVPAPQNPLPLAGEERGAPVLAVWLRQSGARQQADARYSWPRCVLSSRIGGETPSKIEIYA